MSFRLTPLPYAQTALEPYFSAETLAYHHGKHHQAYVNQLNQLIANTAFQHSSLESIIQTAQGPIFNNASQVWNHEFYWHCLATPGKVMPQALESLLKTQFGDVTAFKRELFQKALSVFGSGWTWLVKTPEDSCVIRTLANGDSPLLTNDIPLLAVDVWEHAYYIDYRNQRAVYLEALWQCIHWEFVYARFNQPLWQSDAKETSVKHASVH